MDDIVEYDSPLSDDSADDFWANHAHGARERRLNFTTENFTTEKEDSEGTCVATWFTVSFYCTKLSVLLVSAVVRPTNLKLRLEAVALVIAVLVLLATMVAFTTRTKELSATLVTISCAFGLVIAPIAAYIFMLFTKQTNKATSSTSFGLKVTWQLDWFVEWKYRLILILLLTNFIFHQGLTVFVVQASGSFVLSVAKDALSKSPAIAGIAVAFAGIALVGIAADLRAFWFHTTIIKYDGFDETTRRHRPLMTASLLVAIDCITLAMCIGSFALRVNSGLLVAIVLTTISLGYTTLYSVQAWTGKKLDLEWHVYAQNLVLQHLFILTTSAAIVLDQVIVANLDTSFSDLVLSLNTIDQIFVYIAMVAYCSLIIHMTVAVNLHSGVQQMLESFVIHKLAHG